MKITIKDLQGEYITFKVIGVSSRLKRFTGLNLDDWCHISFSGLDKGEVYFRTPAEDAKMDSLLDAKKLEARK